ncbi:MAG: sulfatase-like hydrolase/transferase [Pirellulaceae bacterium]|nr:sulfatase-like hydrolase/transferase [Pirellulaceae bacterium]
MTVRQHAPLVVLWIGIMVSQAMTFGAYEQGETGERRPHFLIIVADDQSPLDLKVYDPKSQLDTPHIDRIATTGMVIDAAYHLGSYSGAVCLPSRYMIMSGRSLWRLPGAPGGKDRCPPDLHEHTLPAVLNRAGYITMRTCKQGNSYEAANRQFAVRHDQTKRGSTHSTGSPWHVDRVIEFLQSRAAEADMRPFLIYLGFSHPHDPRDGPKDLLNKYGAINHTDPHHPPAANTQAPRLPVNYLPAHPFSTTHDDVRDEIDVSGVWRRRDQATVRNEIGRQFACCEYLDQQVGRVLDHLESMGELDNTYVVYTADHGIAIGRHGLMGKQNLYQHTWRVPMIVSGPGIAPGSRATGNVYLMDLLATVCDWAGIAAPESNEGQSFRAVVEGQAPQLRDVMYGAYSGGAKPGIRCVQHGDWKLIQYAASDHNQHQLQLFNLAENPYELLVEHHDSQFAKLLDSAVDSQHRNLANDPQYARQLEAMRQLLDAQMQTWDDPYRTQY